MTFKFQEDDKVVLIDGEGHASFLPVGSLGIVFCQYTTTPPAYEVNFRDVSGKELGSIVYEDEIELARDGVTVPVREAAWTA